MTKEAVNNQFIRKRVNVAELKIGMYVTELDRPWLQSPFLYQGFFLITEKHVSQVHDFCDYVYIDTTKQIASDDPVLTLDKKFKKSILHDEPPPPYKKSFAQEFDKASKIYDRTARLVKGFMTGVGIEKQVDIEEAKKAVDECVKSVINTPDALMWLTQLKKKDEYTSQHSMNVCLLSIALGRHLNLPEGELRELGLCGMLHDMGKMQIPLRILNKPGQLVGKEILIMQHHTTLGLQILKKSKGRVPLSVLNVAYSHHERIDGKGYPRGLTQKKLTQATRIVSIVDMYDALTSDRVYQKGCSHLEAINILTKVSGTQLDYGLVVKFIECLSVYPPGNLVEMTNGELAIVIEINQQERLRPKVILSRDKHHLPVEERMINLSKRERDSHGQIYTIKRTVRAEDYDINIMKIYHSNIVQKGLQSIASISQSH
jgi:putative nucleotidyltransferase with HDIG domain